MTTPSKLAASILLAAAVARADGAFPNAIALFLPPDQPQRLLLSTNFGLLQSVDNGQTWNISCELGMLAPNAYIYQVGPGPDHRILALSLNGLTLSDDDACTWSLPDGGLPTASFRDAFVDPSDGAHVIAIIQPELPDAGVAPETIVESHAGGVTFDSVPVYVAPAQSYLTGLEISRSTPSRWYATMYVTTPSFRPFLLRSDDDGGTWIANELTGSVGVTTLRLIGVDPNDSTTVYLRLVSATAIDSLAVATDGGASATSLLTLPAGQSMSGFVKRADGSLVVTQFPGPGSFVSTDQGATFQPYLAGFHVMSVAERDGGLFVAENNNSNDGFAVGIVSDGGIQPLFRYQDLNGLLQCGNIPAACANWWDGPGQSCERRILGVPPGTCGPPSDGGADAGAADGGVGAAKSCGCTSNAGSAVFLAGVLAVLAALARRRRQ